MALVTLSLKDKGIETISDATQADAYPPIGQNKPISLHSAALSVFILLKRNLPSNLWYEKETPF